MQGINEHLHEVLVGDQPRAQHCYTCASPLPPQQSLFAFKVEKADSQCGVDLPVILKLAAWTPSQDLHLQRL